MVHLPRATRSDLNDQNVGLFPMSDCFQCRTVTNAFFHFSLTGDLYALPQMFFFLRRMFFKSPSRNVIWYVKFEQSVTLLYKNLMQDITSSFWTHFSVWNWTICVVWILLWGTKLVLYLVATVSTHAGNPPFLFKSKRYGHVQVFIST